ncbi:branched-chain amino acid ABC transporter permease [Nocardioides nitrophenolicus]|uniref:branched-chain amino acid ABC transporter permease n=1 Tax=Nocardioides nitrophenolicus TaxID=60489 RepID=UPI00195855FF|nr:branched-chain amino acid ABC transporter permease [Nocardioides nitrophenolicus]MBM7517166.1 branched-chain amino acid transport system permease protein [Nocardioides nitrophenolicus]
MTTTAPADDVTATMVETPVRRGRRRGTLIGLGVALGALLGGLAVPYAVTDTYRMSLVVDGTVLSLMAIGIGFLARHLGMISLGHGAFFGAAAYGVGVATSNWGWSPTAAVGFGVVVGTVVALVMGLLVVRASGFGFLMLTLALSQALYSLSVQTSARPLTGAHDGKLLTYDRDLTFLGLNQADVMNPGLFWPFAWIALTVSVTVLWLVGRSRFGTTLEGIRENEERMRFSGYDTFGPRLAAFVLSGAVASLGGALFAINAGYVSPDILGFSKAGDSLIAALVGGFGLLLGPVVGTFLFVYAQANFNFGGNLHLFTGLALIVVLVFMPGGITGAFQKLYHRIRKGRR